MLLIALTVSMVGQEEYADSIFQVRLQEEQLVDSTLADKMYYRLYEGCKYMNTDPALAYSFFDDCIRLDSTVSQPKLYAAAAYQLYRIFAANNQYSNALGCISAAVKHSPDNKTYIEDYAWFMSSVGVYDVAVDNFKKLTKMNPSSSDYFLGLMHAYRQKKQYPKAMEQIAEYEKLEGASIYSMTQRAELWMDMKKPQKAIKDIFKYLDKNPNDKLDAYFLISRIYGLDKKYDKSLDLLLELEREYPDNISVYLNLADYYNRLDDEKKKNDCLYKALLTKSLSPAKAVEYMSPMVAGFLQDNDTVSASSLIDTLISIYPDEPQVVTMQCDMYKAVKDTLRLEAALYHLRDLNQKDERIDWQLIEIAENRGDNEALKKLTAEGYHRFKSDRWAYIHLISYAREDKTDSILELSGRMLSKMTDKNIISSVYQLIGDIYSSKDMIAEATEMYDSCLVYNPNNAGALNNLAYNITKEPGGDLARAEKMAVKALENDPESTTVLDTYAWILCLRGDYYLASFYFDKLVRLENEKNEEPGFEVLYHRAVLSLHRDKPDEAVVLLEKALKIYENNPDRVSESELYEKIISLLDELK